MPTVFESILQPLRYLPPRGRRGDFAAPLMMEADLQTPQTHLLVTNTRGTFVGSYTNPTGTARMGFFPCTLEEENPLFRALYEQLRLERGLRCSAVQAAVDRLRGSGLEAKAIVVSEEEAVTMLGLTEPLAGCFAGTVNGMKVLVSDLPRGAAIVVADPVYLGLYARVSDHLGILLQHMDRSMVVVDDMAG